MFEQTVERVRKEHLVEALEEAGLHRRCISGFSPQERVRAEEILQEHAHRMGFHNPPDAPVCWLDEIPPDEMIV
jgi:hypothetical protein